MIKKSIFGMLVAGCVPAFAGINSDLEKLGGAAAEGYLGPIVSTIGSDLNQGWFREAPKPVLWGIDFSGRLVVTGTFFDASAERFTASSSTQLDEQTAGLLAEEMVPDNLTGAPRTAAVNAVKAQLVGTPVNMAISGPTIIGSSDEEITYTVSSDAVIDVNGQSVALEGQSVGLGVSGADLAGFLPGVVVPFPQINIGTLAGTQLAIRAAPSMGDFSFFGFGVNHNPGFWLEQAQLPFGINSSVNFAYTSLSYGDYMEFSAWNAGVMASRRFGWRFLHVTPYAALGVEGSSLEVSYETAFKDPSTGKPIKVGFEADGENLFRATVGTNLRLGILDLSGDFTLAKYNSLSVVAGLGF
jgi:hypothetical protein